MSTKGYSNRLAGLSLGGLICLPMALRAAINLKVFEIIAAAGEDAQLSPLEIAAKIPTTNPNAAASLNRILRILAANSLLTISFKSLKEEDNNVSKWQAVYGLSSLAASLVPGEDGASAAAEYLLSTDKVTLASLYQLEEAVLEEGCVPFERAHGESLFEYGGRERRYMGIFHEAMSNISSVALNEVFKVYKGFDEVREMLLDVGGGVGTSISMIVAKYPHIRGLNFDLHYVIADAPKYPGVEHVEGNMFEGLPSAETIFMKGILHDWDDEKCLEILRNCCMALPEDGKIINVEFVIPPQLGIDFVSRHMTGLDIMMMACASRGRERTMVELSELAGAAGFQETKDFPVAHGLHVIEFHKNVKV